MPFKVLIWLQHEFASSRLLDVIRMRRMMSIPSLKNNDIVENWSDVYIAAPIQIVKTIRLPFAVEQSTRNIFTTLMIYIYINIGNNFISNTRGRIRFTETISELRKWKQIAQALFLINTVMMRLWKFNVNTQKKREARRLLEIIMFSRLTRVTENNTRSLNLLH